MTVIINKTLKSGVKTITGKLISDGMGVLTVAVLNSQGSHSIKRFKKSTIANYTVID